MDRREFISASGIGVAASVLTNARLMADRVQAPAPVAGRAPSLLRLGSNASAYNEADLIRVGRFGVTSIVSGVQRADSTKLGVTREDLMKMRENRLHTSFIKDLAPEFGRGARITYTINFF